MLDTTTKRRIDTARDILVGKIPDPKSQVEQITIALIYKFMDDMDAEAEELGGSRKFFADGFSKYGWARLMHTGLGGHEMLDLYAEAISHMPENPGIPPLFRNIFKNAYLPYRDPETLRSFLKIIDEFSYDHSERLGDAFEYLLSVLGSQGDAGQFRTPRHIIDFIVEIVAPQKNETVLDPACGTAGFLISSYKHILKNNLDQNGYSTLTPDEKGRMVENFKGYDISPDMVRLSLVNLYLHGFSDPHIYEYDTLTSQERWNEYADVILANPPFMSPKGGIRPHNRFSVQSKRSEVLFVDYIADHLTPEGRAGVIVPEGIIFQSQNAYKQLRKKLVDESLVAVISLPAGVFQPYSGVKTSILIMDKTLSKKADKIAFFKVENDGYGLGAQRRPIDKNDLPQVLSEIKEYLNYIRAGDTSAEYLTQKGLVVKREKIAENGECNLSGERYRESISSGKTSWPLVKLGDYCIIQRGGSPRPINDFLTDDPTGVNWIKIGDAKIKSKFITSTKERIKVEGMSKTRKVKPGDLILSNSMSFGRPYIMAIEGCIHDGWLLLRITSNNLDTNYLYHILGSELVKKQFVSRATGGVVNNLNSDIVREVAFPLPPLEIQKDIVAEIETYQKVIDGARAVVENYRPHIPIDPTWPLVMISDICNLIGGSTPSKKEPLYWNNGEVKWISSKHINEMGVIKGHELISNKAVKDNTTKVVPPNSTIIITRVSVGKYAITDDYYAINQDLTALVPREKNVLPEFIYRIAPRVAEIVEQKAEGIGVRGVTREFLSKVNIPLPPLETQKALVAEIETEQTIVNANRELIERFEKKIENAINRIWGEEG